MRFAPIETRRRNQTRQGDEWDLRLSGLAAAGLASRFTSSHFDGFWRAKIERWMKGRVSLVIVDGWERKFGYVTCGWLGERKRL